MTDIVERLRSGEDGLEYAAADEIDRLREEVLSLEATGAEASDKIERLREALRDMLDADNCWLRGNKNGEWAVKMAVAKAKSRTALGDYRE